MKNKIINYFLCIFSLVLVIKFYNNELLLFILLFILSIILLLLKKSKIELTLFIISGIFGPLAEIVSISSGAWTYSKISLLIVPLWLFPLWGIAAIFIKRLYDDIDFILK